MTPGERPVAASRSLDLIETAISRCNPDLDFDRKAQPRPDEEQDGVS
jgi:hypothetical protein